jgi:hypothetical protein
MRSFWKTHSNKGLELYLKNAVSSATQYCHRFAEIPQSSEQSLNQGLEERIKQAAENAPDDSEPTTQKNQGGPV